MLGLICIDVDGTLVGSGGGVLPEVWAAADRTRAMGVKLAICTGRPAFGKARGYAQRLDPDGYHIFQSGASVVNVTTGDSRSEGLPSTALGTLVDRARRLNRILEVYTDTEYAVERTERRAVEHADLLGVPFEPRDLLSLTGKVVRAQWVIPNGQLGEILREEHDDLTLSPAGSPIMPDTTFISLTRAGIDKGSAIRAVAQAYGVPLERTMMVGDGHNDAVGMHTVGHPVAMGNADAEARAAARIHVAHVDQGGLAEAIELALTL